MRGRCQKQVAEPAVCGPASSGNWGGRGCCQGPHLTCGDAALGVQAEDSVGADGAVREEAGAGLQWEGAGMTQLGNTLPPSQSRRKGKNPQSCPEPTLDLLNMCGFQVPLGKTGCLISGGPSSFESQDSSISSLLDTHINPGRGFGGKQGYGAKRCDQESMASRWQASTFGQPQGLPSDH